MKTITSMARLLLLTVALVLAAGCEANNGSSTGAAQNSNRSHVRDVSIHDAADLTQFLRKSVAYDYESYRDPAAMAADVTVAVRGTVAGVRGATLRQEPEDQGYMLVDLNVTESFKSKAISPSVVTFSILRPNNISVESLAKGMPVGSTIAMFGMADPAAMVDGDELPNDAVAPVAQGLFLSNDGINLDNVWGDVEQLAAWSHIETFEDLDAAVGTSR